LCRVAAALQAGNTPLHNAAYEGWLDGVNLLLQAGAKVNASNNVRFSCRTLTRETRPATLAPAVPRCAASPARPPRARQAGDTPWHWAEAMSHAAVMALLEANGAGKEPGAIVVPEHINKIKAR
jgi:ankyrin repeat protein